VAETDRHFQLMVDLRLALDRWFRSDPDVYVSGNLLLFYEEGNKRRHVSPDVFVVFGVPKGGRLNYLLWEEGRGPNVIIELTSSSTRHEDTRRKFELYRDILRVPEYFLFDPFGDYLSPRFQGYRLTAGEYRPMRSQANRIRSRQLSLWLEPDGDSLRLVDPATNVRLLNMAEVEAAADENARAASAERLRAARAEAELERLRAENAALRRRPNGRNGH
jgi:Uma2 family endonuclease